MSDGSVDLREEARSKAWSMPIEAINVADPELFRHDLIWPYFERLRKEAPVHYQKNHEFGPYWSITKFQDILFVDSNHKLFSSEPAITMVDPPEEFRLPMFIAMDQPKHDAQRKVVSPIVAPQNLARLEGLIRERVGKIFDELPRGTPFDWVDKVSVELTTQMLATLFDFPWEDRRLLTYWSDTTTSGPASDMWVSAEHRRTVLFECADYFLRLWNERVNATEPGNDLISMLAHGESTRNMDRMEYLGNLLLLIVGGNDTTRNSLTGGLYALNRYRAEYEKLLANPSLVPSMVSEIIRWQTPLAYMRRTALADVEIRGQTIRKGDKVLMWYVSGNRDEDEIENADAFIIDRPNPRHHLSFGFGIHRCVGNRLAELQLRIVWEEILKRFGRIEVLEEPTRTPSPFVKGYTRMMVQLPMG